MMKSKYISFAIALIGALILCAVSGAQNGRCEIYCYIDSQGVYHYTDSPTSAQYVPVNFSPNWQNKPKKYERHFDRLINAVSERIGVRSELLKAVIKVESNFNPQAVSKAGAVGLMQIMPAHFEKINVSNPFDPEANILIGAKYLKRLIKRYDGNLPLSLAAYNAGPEIVDRYGDVPPYKETQVFVKKVLTHYHQYRQHAN